jgi:hypothetical protein
MNSLDNLCPKCALSSYSLGIHQLFVCVNCRMIDSDSVEAQLVWCFQSSRIWEMVESVTQPDLLKVI